MKQKMIINDKTYEVEVGDLTSCPVRVNVNGKDYGVILENPAAESPRAIKPLAASAPIPASQPRPIAAPHPAAPSPADTGKDIRSPMPGTILEINVMVGEQVKIGQQVCSLEAMKMKNAIRSNLEGVVASVEVTQGQKVNSNDVILRFE